MGDGSARDEFAPHLDAFFHSLKQIPRGDRIILNGDVIDIWRYDFDDILKVYGDLLEDLASRDVTWLAGNHDRRVLDLSFQKKLPQGFVFAKRTIIDRWYICHGDEFDLSNGRWFWLGKAATETIAAIGHVSPKLEKALAHLPGKLTKVGRHSQKHTFRQHALGFILDFLGSDDRWLRGIVCGHTHRVAHERAYVNTGYWIKDGWTRL